MASDKKYRAEWNAGKIELFHASSEQDAHEIAVEYVRSMNVIKISPAKAELSKLEPEKIDAK